MPRSITGFRRHALAALWCAGVAVVSSSVAAEPAGTTAGDRAAAQELKAKRATARQYVEAGRAALEKLQNYGAAVQWFQLAYDLVPEPVLLYNMANAHRLAGHDAEALDLYQRYLDADPGGPVAEDARRRIEPLRAAVAADQIRRAEETRVAEVAQRAAREAEEIRQKEAAALAEKARLYDEAVAEQARRRKEAGERARANMGTRREVIDRERQQAATRRRLDRYRRIGLGLGATGLAAVGVGLYFGLRAGRLADEVAVAYDPGSYADGQFAERVQVRSLAAGGVLVLAGSALLYYERRARRRTSPLMITPTTDAPGAAVAFVGRW